MAEGERSITLKRRLRPLRIGLLVQPSSRAQLRRAIELCTGWSGGSFNPIIPVHRSRPRWLADAEPGLGGRTLTEGLLATFEPDVLVELAPDLAQGLGRELPVVGPEQVWPSTAHGPPVGLDARSLHAWAFRQELRFAPRGSGSALLPRAARGDEAWSDLLCGRFGADAWGEALAHSYSSAFQPTSVPVDRKRFAEIFSARWTPLTATGWGIESREPQHRVPVHLLLDPGRVEDRHFAWNLRALGLIFWMVPLRISSAFPSALGELLASGQAEAPTGSMPPTVLAAPSVGRGVLDSYARILDQAGQAVAQQPAEVGGLLRLWRPEALRAAGIDRVELAWEQSTAELVAHDRRVSFELPGPPWADQPVAFDATQWATVIELEDRSAGGELAKAFPPDVGELGRRLSAVGPGHGIHVTSEGLVVRGGSDWPGQLWDLPSGTEVLQWMFERQGVSTRVSAAGRATAQTLRALGGPLGAVRLASPELVRLIGWAAGRPGGPGVITRGELQKVLSRTHDNHALAMAQHLEGLTQRVLAVQMKAVCSLCAHSNHYSPEELGPELECRRCLRSFRFPAAQPPQRDEWAYRPIGPFAAPDQAQGAYSVVLALRWLTILHSARADLTWAVSLESSDLDAFELDFAVWLDDRMTHRRRPPRLLLGEAKTFNRFEPRDFKRAKMLVQRFPDAQLVFATLNAELNEEERRGVRRLQGRLGRWQPQPIVLTANEIGERFSRDPTATWRDRGGREAEVAVRHGYVGSDLDKLSRVTLELYATLDDSGKAQG